MFTEELSYSKHSKVALYVFYFYICYYDKGDNLSQMEFEFLKHPYPMQQ